MVQQTHLYGLVGALVACSVAGVGCSTQPPAKTPAEQAKAMEERCNGFRDGSAISEVVSGKAVEGVAPLYSGNETKSSHPRLIGAVLQLRPIRGATAEWLNRALECYGAERTLGRAAGTLGPDPFLLPDATVAVNVKSAGDGFRVELIGAEPDQARDILARAEALGAHAHGSIATEGALP